MKRMTVKFFIMILATGLSYCNPPDYSKYMSATDLAPSEFQILQPRKGHRYRLDMITIEPGSEIYSAWGHTAIRIVDSQRKFDAVFDYGLFDFSADFIIRFLKGKPAFKIGASHYYSTLLHYKKDNRRIFTQELTIPDSQIASLLKSLILNTAPQNRTFLYHHFNDNCTTRIRDRVDEALRGDYKSLFVNKYQGRSFRDGSMDLLLGRPILWTSANMILGSNVDKKIDQWQNQFLPMDLMIALDKFREQGNEDRVGKLQIVLEPSENGFSIQLQDWFMPSFFMILILILFFYLPIVKPHNRYFKQAGRWGWFFWNFSAGLLGSVFFMTWFFTNHDSTYNNMNLLAYSPLLLLNIVYSLWLRHQKNDLLLTQIHKILIVPPLVGFAMSLLGIVDQFAWPYLGFATIVQTLLYFYFQQRFVVQKSI